MSFRIERPASSVITTDLRAVVASNGATSSAAPELGLGPTDPRISTRKELDERWHSLVLHLRQQITESPDGEKIGELIFRVAREGHQQSFATAHELGLDFALEVGFGLRDAHSEIIGRASGDVADLGLEIGNAREALMDAPHDELEQMREMLNVAIEDLPSDLQARPHQLVLQLFPPDQDAIRSRLREAERTGHLELASLYLVFSRVLDRPDATGEALLEEAYLKALDCLLAIDDDGTVLLLGDRQREQFLDDLVATMAFTPGFEVRAAEVAELRT